MNATDIARIRREASSPFWWTRFWTFRRFTLDLCYELERARKALEFGSTEQPDLKREVEHLRAAKLADRTSIVKLLQFIHVHNKMGSMKPKSQITP